VGIETIPNNEVGVLQTCLSYEFREVRVTATRHY